MTKTKAPRNDGRSYLTFSQRLTIYEKLQEVCKQEVIDGKNYAIFDGGWNDHKVVQAMDFPCTNHNVTSIREERIGIIRVPQPPKAKAVEPMLPGVDINYIALDNRLADVESVTRDINRRLDILVRLERQVSEVRASIKMLDEERQSMVKRQDQFNAKLVIADWDDGSDNAKKLNAVIEWLKRFDGNFTA